MSANWKLGILDGSNWHNEDWKTAGRHLTPYENLKDVALETGIYNVRTEKMQQFVEWNGQFIPTNDYKLANVGATWTADGVQFLNRSVTRYNPLQNSYLVDTFEPLSKNYDLAGLGMVGERGQITFIQFKLGEYEIHGEEHQTRLTIGDDKEAGGTFYFKGNQRVVCENTWRSAIRNVEPIPHGMDIEAMMNFLAVLENATIAQHQNEVAVLNRMFATRVKKGQVNELAELLFPEPTKSKKLRLIEKGMEHNLELDQQLTNLVDKEVSRHEGDLQRMETRRQNLANEFFTFSADHESGDSLYSLFNAVTGYVNHHSDFRGDRSMALMFGDRGELTEKAWNYCEKSL